LSVLAALSRPSASTTPYGFDGWRIVGYASRALAATGPGQTVGVTLFVDPLVADLGVSRSAVSTAHLVVTLAGALALPWIGRALDRYGIRRTMAVIGPSSVPVSVLQRELVPRLQAAVVRHRLGTPGRRQGHGEDRPDDSAQPRRDGVERS
jgi:hypothetical protein